MKLDKLIDISYLDYGGINYLTLHELTWLHGKLIKCKRIEFIH
jgi:hypothetical protein